MKKLIVVIALIAAAFHVYLFSIDNEKLLNTTALDTCLDTLSSYENNDFTIANTRLVDTDLTLVEANNQIDAGPFDYELKASLKEVNASNYDSGDKIADRSIWVDYVRNGSDNIFLCVFSENTFSKIKLTNFEFKGRNVFTSDRGFYVKARPDSVDLLWVVNPANYLQRLKYIYANLTG